MNKDIVKTETLNSECIPPFAPPLATVLDISNSSNANRNIYYEAIERNNINNINNNNSTNNSTNNNSSRLVINPVKCLKLTANGLLTGIFITIFIFESDDISRKELLYYILLSIIAIGK
jgi:hypothetical protein